MAQELSLYDLYNKILQQQSIYGERLDKLYSMFSGTLAFPKGVSNSNDSPGLWPDSGMNVYAILSEYNLAESFCTVGTLLNIGMGRYKYQIMVVQQDELHPIKNGKLYYRYGKASDNEWSGWKRFVYLYELTGSIDSKGNPVKDDNGKNITDTEDEKPEDNKHNQGGGGSSSGGGGSGSGGDSGKVTIVADEAHSADKLTTARKIELTDLVDGSVMFDGSQDVQIDVTSKKVVPINIQLPASHPAYDTYRLLCTLPSSVTTTYDYVIINGHIGGWTKDQGKADIIISASNREGEFVNGLVIGSINCVDIIAYKTVEGLLKIYLKIAKDGWCDDVKLSIYGSEQIIIENKLEALLPSYVECWRASKDCVSILGRTINGDVSGEAKTAVHADCADTVMVNCENSTRAYITGTPAYGKYSGFICDSNVMLDKASGAIIANTFVGNLNGTADYAKEANYASSVIANRNTTTKGYLLGVTGTSPFTPFYDDQIYLMTRPGGLHSDYIEGSLGYYNRWYADALVATYSEQGTIAILQKIVMNNNRIYFDNGTKAGMYYNSASGFITSDVDFAAPKVHNAIYNDYAEYFPRGEATEPGDVIMLDLDSDKEQYIKSQDGAKCAIGVHSDSFGHIVGGVNPINNQTLEEANKDFIPVALSGRVRVNFIGKSEKGAKVVATNDGCARLYNKETDDIDSVLGYLVESDNLTDKRRLKMKIK